jgi:hypothetical protein
VRGRWSAVPKLDEGKYCSFRRPIATTAKTRICATLIRFPMTVAEDSQALGHPLNERLPAQASVIPGD